MGHHSLRTVNSSLYFSNMGGFGFFFDNLVRAIVKGVRRESRASTAAAWPIVDAKITNLSWGEESRRPSVTYSYAVNGETWYGTCTGSPSGVRELGRARSAMSAVRVLHVRYDPCDSGSSRVLNSDNPDLPFEIDQDLF